MKIIETIAEIRALRRSAQKIAFVPTMGNLHAGHIDLCLRAKAENDIVVASVFVNPTQFNQASDFEKYARTLEADRNLLSDAGVDYLFNPAAADMYADGYTVKVSEDEIAQELEGAFRPGHFTGMLTVVLKLLNIIGADRAYFGEKDFQQLKLIEDMVTSFFMNIEIVHGKTIREDSGLAMSSRNRRLSPAGFEKAALIYKLLKNESSVENIKKQHQYYCKLFASWKYKF